MGRYGRALFLKFPQPPFRDAASIVLITLAKLLAAPFRLADNNDRLDSDKDSIQLWNL